MEVFATLHLEVPFDCFSITFAEIFYLKLDDLDLCSNLRRVNVFKRHTLKNLTVLFTF